MNQQILDKANELALKIETLERILSNKGIHFTPSINNNGIDIVESVPKATISIINARIFFECDKELMRLQREFDNLK